MGHAAEVAKEFIRPGDRQVKISAELRTKILTMLPLRLERDQLDKPAPDALKKLLNDAEREISALQNEGVVSRFQP